MNASSELGSSVTRAGHVVLCGTCSWTDKTLVQETDWYPARSMSAEDRLRFYAAQFPVVEVDSTYYAPPAEQQARLWAERTPDGFRFDVKAYSLLTGHPTKPQSLWVDLRDDLPEEVGEKRNIYASHLAPAQLDEAWRRFHDALWPLHETGRLGAVCFSTHRGLRPRRRIARRSRRFASACPTIGLCRVALAEMVRAAARPRPDDRSDAPDRSESGVR
jgi:uncharacterized protein YecE (DUF72 family)